MRKSPCGTFFGLRQRSKRAYTPRADVQSIMDMHLRAHIQIQKYRAARTIRSRICSGCTNTIWLPPGRSLLSSFGRHVILEAEYVRDSSLEITLHVRATTPYARFDRCLRGSRANRKKLRRAFFACFGLPNTVRAKPWGACLVRMQV